MLQFTGAVGEHSIHRRSSGVSQGGEDGRDYVSTSSVKVCEKQTRRKPKVSWGRIVRPGLVGPKSRPKGVDDGQQVNIPVPSVMRLTYGGTQEDRCCRALVVPVQAFRVVIRQIRSLLARRVTRIPGNQGEVTDSTLPRKTSLEVSWMTVP